MDIKETLKYLKLRESTISMLFGAVSIILVGVLLINYFSKRTDTNPRIIEIGDEENTSRTHVVQEGEQLWGISEKYYGTGYNWVDIAKANNIENADEIEAGQTLIIPEISPIVASTGTEASPTTFPIENEIPSETPVATETAIPTATKTPSPTVITENGQGAVSTEATTHTVSEGETLWSIAEKYYKSGFNWTDIAETNRIENPNEIEEGIVIFIPNAQPKKMTVVTSGSTQLENAISGATYTVQKGDNLWDIAVRAYGDGYKWIEISRENNLSHPNLIHP